MNLLKEQIPCTLFFKINPDEFKASEAKINPYTGSIKHKFSGLNASHVVFEHDSKIYQFEIFNLGGRYFMKDYESSPFYRLFSLSQNLAVKKEPYIKKLKI
jgi:hypothetical protein